MLKGALTPDAFAKVEAAVERSLAHPSPTAVRFYPGETATFFEDRGRSHAGLVREIGLDTTLAALWGVDRIWYLGEQLFLKEGGAARRTPWHQDTSYLRMMGSQLVACWISLDPLPKEHCLEFVRGSHQGVLYNGSAFAAARRHRAALQALAAAAPARHPGRRATRSTSPPGTSSPAT